MSHCNCFTLVLSALNKLGGPWMTGRLVLMSILSSATPNAYYILAAWLIGLSFSLQALYRGASPGQVCRYSHQLVCQNEPPKIKGKSRLFFGRSKRLGSLKMHTAKCSQFLKQSFSFCIAYYLYLSPFHEWRPVSFKSHGACFHNIIMDMSYWKEPQGYVGLMWADLL